MKQIWRFGIFPVDLWRHRQQSAWNLNMMTVQLMVLIMIIIIIINLVSTFCSDLDIKLVFTPFKIKSWLGSRILFLRVYDRELFISFHVQAVMPVMLVKPTDTSPLASANISPLTNIPTPLRTWEVLKIVAPFVQKIVLKFWTLRPQASNWKSRKPCTSFGSSRL